MRNVERRKLIGGVISALLAFCGYTIGNAYTYSGVTSTVTEPTFDSTEFVVTNKSNINILNNLNAIKKDKKVDEQPSSVESMRNTDMFLLSGSWMFEDDDAEIAVNGKWVVTDYYIHFNEKLQGYKIFGTNSFYAYGRFADNVTNTYGNPKLKVLTRDLTSDDMREFSAVVYGKGGYEAFAIYDEEFKKCTSDDEANSLFQRKYPNLYKAIVTKWYDDYDVSDSFFDESNEENILDEANKIGHVLVFTGNNPYINNIISDSSITVSNQSILSGNVNVQTSKFINVNGTSTLSAVGTITGGTITSDGDIVAASNYSVPSGKSTITAPTINATGALTASKDISATSGSVSANTIQATTGNITASDTITVGGTVKANSINATGVNASSATITGNQSIGGVFTATGQANLNGGATLNNKKITGLADGALSASSTDAVNGRQLYNALQNAGKTYTAGSDISISSANAISVSKAGQIASGNTGIVTGGTVYTVTSVLSSTITDQGKQLTAATTSIKTINSAVENVRKSLSDLNTSNANFLSTWNSNSKSYVNKDLSNLSADGTASLKAMIKTEVQNQIANKAKITASTSASTATLESKTYSPITTTADASSVDTSYVDKAVAEKADKSELDALSKVVDTKADKTHLDNLTEKVNAKADLSYVNDELAKKADKSTVDALAKDVKTNAEHIASNIEAIKANTTNIAGLKESKANVDASNIDVKAWGDKLGTGVIEKDNKGLVTGGVVFDALDKKADIGYVNAGFAAMEGQMKQMNQSLTRDIARVGAGAAALAGLHPQDYDPNNKLDFAVGYGHYKNANATALGMYYRPNAGTTFSLASTIGNGDPMLSAGLSFKLGMGKNVEKVVVTKEDFESMQAEMQAQDETLQQMEDTLRKLMA